MFRWIITILLMFASAILTRVIPFSSFFRTLNTMLHEFGHAAATLLTSGKVLRIELNPDHSGVTYSLISSKWSSFIAGIAGYPAASLFAVLLFYLFAKRQERLGIWLLTAIALSLLIFLVHSGFGVSWLIGFMLVNGIALLLGRTVTKYYYLLLLFLTLEESVLSGVYLFILSLTEPQQAGDAAGLQQLTGIPAVFWSVLFLVFALLCARECFRHFFKRLSSSQVQRQQSEQSVG